MHKKEREIYKVGLTFWPNAKLRIIHLQAICALSQGDTTVANEYLTEFTAIGEQNGWSESNILYWLGGAYDQANDIKQAENLYRNALAINPSYFPIMNDLAYLLITNDINIAEGIELINSVLENELDNGDYLHTFGLGLYKQGKIKEAQEVLIKAWDLIPYYDHDHFLHIKEVEKALASQSN